MSRTSDAAWKLIAALPRGGVQGKVFVMTRNTMRTIQRERGKPFVWNLPYRLYGVRVTYDDRMPDGLVTLEEP